MSASPIVVNLRSVGAGLKGGVPRYVSEVVGRLPRLETLKPSRVPASGPMGHLWEQAVLPARIGRGQLLWSPGNFGPVVHGHQVVSIYDLSPIDHPEWFGRQYATLFRAIVPVVARRALHVITISEFSKERIVDRLDIPADSITVAEPGVSNVFTADQQVERGNDIVVLAGPDPRKNLDRVLQAFGRVADDLPHVRLLVVTGKRASGVFAPTALDNHANVVAITDPTDDELVQLYRSARAVVSVPLYEGYGLPAAEALASGAPLIVSDIAAHDHARAAAIAVVDPTDVGAIAEAMLLDEDGSDPSRPIRRWGQTASVIQESLDRFC